MLHAQGNGTYCKNITDKKYCEKHREWGAVVDKKMVEIGYDKIFEKHMLECIEAMKNGKRCLVDNSETWAAIDYCGDLMYDFEKQRFDEAVRKNITLDYFDCKYDNSTGIITCDNKTYRLDLHNGRGQVSDRLFKRKQFEKEILSNITLEFTDETCGLITYDGKRGVLKYEVFYDICVIQPISYTNEMAIIFTPMKPNFQY